MRGRLSLPLILFFLGCARVVTPSGGPPDTDPPEVFRVIPEPGLSEMLPDRILIEFSERISGEVSMVDVYPVEAEVRVGNRSIEVRPEGGETEVIILTVSKALQDRRGNPLPDAVVLVWNTAPAEEFAVFKAQVTRTGGGTVTEAARCDMFLLPDTASPVFTGYPDSTGSLLAGWLPEGEYRIICYEDQDASRSWDPEREAGTGESITLLAGDTATVDMAMTIVDSIGPVMAGVEALDGWHVEITWNEQISLTGGEIESIFLTGPESLPVTIHGIARSPGRSSIGRITLFTSAMLDTMYTVRLSGIEDLAGNPSLPDSMEFWATDSLPDYAFAVRSAYPEDGGMEVPPLGPFSITFSDWVDLEALDSLYSVTRVFDGAPVPGQLERLSATDFSFVPDMELTGEKQYVIRLDSGLVSLQGDTLAGSSWTFIPAWSDSPGMLGGTITGIVSSSVTVVLAPAGNEGSMITGVFSDGEYSFDEVPAGRYTVSCFVDRNGNGKWDPGEPYGAWPGVTEVLPGWETADVDLQVVP